MDITNTMAMKEKMFFCHDSQLSWLKAHHGLDEYVASMRALATGRGRLVGVEFAEGFRQHRGHAFPQNNFLLEQLGSLVHEIGLSTSGSQQ